MRKSQVLLIFVYSVVIVFMIATTVTSLFQIDLLSYADNPFFLSRFGLIIGLFGLSLSMVVLVLLQIATLNTRYQLNRQLKRILNNQPLRKQADDEYSLILQRLSNKMNEVTTSLQQIENGELESRETIVEEERKRVARDLHDTVSQELFAASMILSGLSGQLPALQKEQIGQQLQTVSGILDSAQKELRILLLHLRPLELEGRTLVDGFHLILQEVKDKSDVKVIFNHDDITIPKNMEAHIFRIAQEFINNTLRHAQAKNLAVYLFQNDHELQLRMTDDGIGYDPQEIGEVSYGLKNIRERVADMAGTVRVTTAPRKGVAMDIRIPIMRRRDNEHD
ncbi:sensor histidine kinase [Streptococcus merionis]|uniref:Sensor histidine kinase n=1 Tax=Streptococcus merionis TaxID=400065 RepID=A0A239SNP2_9STRE|nr:sensor histidine kinase [Streptococcus merionis]SNU86364.1 putative histidine kinase [Streptococcus merionis]